MLNQWSGFFGYAVFCELYVLQGKVIKNQFIYEFE